MLCRIAGATVNGTTIYDFHGRLARDTFSRQLNPVRWMPWNRRAPLADKPNEQAR
jgi:hypothetical protein